MLHIPPHFETLKVAYCREGTPDPAYAPAVTSVRDLLIIGVLALGLLEETQPPDCTACLAFGRDGAWGEEHLLIIDQEVDTTTTFTLQWPGAFHREKRLAI